MKDLRTLLTEIGLDNVQTYIQSGNVVFESNIEESSILVMRIKEAILKKYSFDVKVLVKNIDEWQLIFKALPFLNHDINKIYVTLLSSTPTNFPQDRVDAVKHDSEDYYFQNSEIYLFYPNGYGKTKLHNTFFERLLKIDATTRNWKTITKINEMLLGKS